MCGDCHRATGAAACPGHAATGTRFCVAQGCRCLIGHVHRLYQRHRKLSLYHQRLATTMTRRSWPMISSCLTSCIVAAASHSKFPDSRFAKSLCCAMALLQRSVAHRSREACRFSNHNFQKINIFHKFLPGHRPRVAPVVGCPNNSLDFASASGGRRCRDRRGGKCPRSLSPRSRTDLSAVPTGAVDELAPRLWRLSAAPRRHCRRAPQQPI